MRLAPFQSETSSPLATASPPLALISFTTCWAGPTSLPLPARSPPRSFTTTLAPCSASIRQCSRPTPRAAAGHDRHPSFAQSCHCSLPFLSCLAVPSCASLAAYRGGSPWTRCRSSPPNRSAFPQRGSTASQVDERLGRQRPPGRHGGRRHAQGRTRLRRDLRQGRRRAQQADAARHHLPHLFHDQAAHLDGDHDALRGGPLPARRPDLEIHPRLRQPARLCRRQPRQDRFGAGRARDHLPRPADPHVGPDLRLHGEQSGRRALPRQGRRRFPAPPTPASSRSSRSSRPSR